MSRLKFQRPDLTTVLFIAALWAATLFLPKIWNNSDQESIEMFEYDADQNTYYVRSPGGHSTLFLERATEIEKRRADIVVEDTCISACAEYYLPAAQNIHFVNAPIIGMHGNPHILRLIKKDFHPRKNGNCLTTSSDNIQKLQERNGVPNSFNLHQISVLEVTNVKLDTVIRGCQTKKVEFKNHMWVPNSDQLRSVMNIDFTGQVCADDIEECQKRIDLRWEVGTRIVLVDNVYISKGR